MDTDDAERTLAYTQHRQEDPPLRPEAEQEEGALPPTPAHDELARTTGPAAETEDPPASSTEDESAGAPEAGEGLLTRVYRALVHLKPDDTVVVDDVAKFMVEGDLQRKIADTTGANPYQVKQALKALKKPGVYSTSSAGRGNSPWRFVKLNAEEAVRELEESLPTSTSRASSSTTARKRTSIKKKTAGAAGKKRSSTKKGVGRTTARKKREPIKPPPSLATVVPLDPSQPELTMDGTAEQVNKIVHQLVARLRLRDADVARLEAQLVEETAARMAAEATLEELQANPPQQIFRFSAEISKFLQPE